MKTVPHLKGRLDYVYRLFAEEPPINVMRYNESGVDQWFDEA